MTTQTQQKQQEQFAKLEQLEKQNLIDCIQDIFKFNTFKTVHYINNFSNFKNLACFDLDHTLIKPKGKRKLPKDKNDYEFMKNVKETLKKYYNNNYNIVIFSNQSGSKLYEVLTKVQNILFELMPIQISVFIATENDYYRKPHTGMFELFLNLNNQKIENFDDIFYCGDAAGRKNDFACSDYAFAHNLSIKYFESKLYSKDIRFYIPEELFLNDKTPYQCSCKDNSLLFVNYYYDNYKEITSNIVFPKPQEQQELVIMCGFPGSGKSTLAHNIYNPNNSNNPNCKNYAIISKDVYKNSSMTIIKKSLKNKLSVVVDDTNVTTKIRNDYIKLAKEHNIPIKCVHVITSFNLCKHLNDMRVEIGNGKIDKIPDIAYNMLNKNYTEPKLNEGFNELYTIPFILPPPNDKNKIPKEFYYIYNVNIY